MEARRRAHFCKFGLSSIQQPMNRGAPLVKAVGLRLMAIPDFTNDGILPPFLGDDPGDKSTLMSPYEVKATDVVRRFNTNAWRATLLRNWLQYRSDMRKAGITTGFQWLDGSFVEDNKEPKDLDIVSFVYRPSWFASAEDWKDFSIDNLNLLDRGIAKRIYSLDIFLIDLNGSIEFIVNASRYRLLLFSHQRNSFLWKGMLKVRLESEGDDDEAICLLNASSYDDESEGW